MSRIETAFLFDLDVEPDLFLMAADRLGAEIEHCVVIGDAIWNMLAAHRREHWGWIALRWIRQEELGRAGAARVYEAPADLLRHVDEIGSCLATSSVVCRND